MSAVNYPVMLVESRKSKAIRWDDRLGMSVLKLSAKLIERGLVIFATLGFSPAGGHFGERRLGTPLLGKRSLFVVPPLGGFRQAFRP
jgi:hypothetical protein